jgi:hypothetical protein
MIERHLLRGGLHLIPAGREIMAEKGSQPQGTRLPQGFTVHSAGLASEYAREQGWGINEEERTKTPRQKQDYDGGTDFDYGPTDFGDPAVDTNSTKPPADRSRSKSGRPKKMA